MTRSYLLSELSERLSSLKARSRLQIVSAHLLRKQTRRNVGKTATLFVRFISIATVLFELLFFSEQSFLSFAICLIFSDYFGFLFNSWPLWLVFFVFFGNLFGTLSTCFGRSLFRKFLVSYFWQTLFFIINLAFWLFHIQFILLLLT